MKSAEKKSVIKKAVLFGTGVCVVASLYVMNDHKRMHLLELNKELLNHYKDDLNYYIDVGYDDQDAQVCSHKDCINKMEQDVQKLESRLCFVLPQKSTQGQREAELKSLLAFHQGVIQEYQQEIDELKAQGFSSKRRRVKDVRERMEREIARVAYLEEQIKQPCYGQSCAKETLEVMVDAQQEIVQGKQEEQQKEDAAQAELAVEEDAV